MIAIRLLPGTRRVEMGPDGGRHIHLSHLLSGTLTTRESSKFKVLGFHSPGIKRHFGSTPKLQVTTCCGRAFLGCDRPPLHVATQVALLFGVLSNFPATLHSFQAFSRRV